MRPGGGKKKGAGFERQVCKILSLWVSAGEREDLFWRSAMSGGRATVQIRKGRRNQTQLGDISSIHPMGDSLTSRFIVECKFKQKLDVDLCAFKHAGALFKFWRKHQELAHANKKGPMLIIRQNTYEPMMIIDSHSLHLLQLSHHYVLHDNRLDMYYIPLEKVLSTPWCLPY